MARIHRLPLHLANQIAAGEVVERPASVVKELIENSLDAGATRISVTIELGGKKLLRVEDDGDGMDPEDARLALERHATSKIASPEDLDAISTLGFRGEALPSIASVSHFVLRTRARGSATGTEIRVNGGTVASEQEVGVPEGTSIEVADLFYNLPARRKFLKSDTAESAQISRLVTQMALGYPEVGFTLTSAGGAGQVRRLMQCPPAKGLGERFFQLFGERLDLIELRKEAGGLQIHGYIAALGDQGPVRGAQNVFVNRRIVKDRTIAHAISEAYSVATIKERSPEVHLFIRIPRRPRGRQRAPDEGGGEVSRAVARARSAAARARRRARAGEGPRAAVHAVRAAAVGAAADVDPGRARRRERRQPLDRRTHGSVAQSHAAAEPRAEPREPRDRTPRTLRNRTSWNPVEPCGTPWNPRRSDP